MGNATECVSSSLSDHTCTFHLGSGSISSSLLATVKSHTSISVETLSWLSPIPTSPSRLPSSPAPPTPTEDTDLARVRVCMDEKRSVRNVKHDKTLDVGYLICVKLVK